MSCAMPAGKPLWVQRLHTTTPKQSFEFVQTQSEALYPVAEALIPRILIDTVHDGAYIPEEFLTNRGGERIDPDVLQTFFISDRDWGANAVAREVSESLGLDGYYRVNLARVLMDFGRFPGSSHSEHGHLQRFAINIPFADFLDHDQKHHVLETHYDGISDAMDDVVRNRVIKIAIHTYDPRNASGTLRPHMSIATRAHAYQHDSRMPFGVFDALYPDILGEYTCDRILRDRLSLTLEKSGIPVAHNYPYLLPEGSIEVRSQVWFFFEHLKNEFEERYPETMGEGGFDLVWEMLHDTNLRSTDSAALRAYIHAYRLPPESLRADFKDALRAYERVVEFLRSDEREIIDRYRFSPLRPSSMAIEVRKDLICSFDDDGRPTELRPANVQKIGQAIAKAIATYLREDRVDHHTDPEFERLDTWISEEA